MPSDLDDIETKLSAARTRLIIDKPFLGALVLRLPMLAADPGWCKTTATDARVFYYNPEYIDDLSIEHTQFVLAHEALHCALSHFARRQHRIKDRWDLACDLAINPLLVKDGLQPPPNALIERSYEGMTAEEIYPLLDEFEDQEPMDQHVYDEENSSGENPQGDRPPQKESPRPRDTPDPGRQEKQGPQQGGQGQGGNPPPCDARPNPDQEPESGGGQGQQPEPDDSQQGAPQPVPLSHSERETLSVQWKQRLAGAAQTALQAGKLDGEMARMVDFLLQPELPWRSLLARYMTSIARDDYSYTRPSSRRGDPAIYPSLRSAQLDVVVALDTSGSISAAEMQEFVSEIDSVKGQMRARILLHACDSELAGKGPWTYEPWEDFEKPADLQGGGGTSFVPIFEWAVRLDRQPDLLIYFTDAEGEFPKVEPEFPVIWLVKGKNKVPWGQRIQLN
ncbi:MAG: vWA domain-containing protein [Alphaproteobacteria bacterium]